MSLITEKIILNEERRVSLVAMIQSTGEKTGKHPAVLILPGGGYRYCAEHEAEVVAYPYLEAGYQAFVLRYSVAEHKTWPNPLNDYEQAMKMIRGNADKWNVIPEKIAVIGFSAGGHLAATAATAAVNRPNAAILGYAATGGQLKGIMHPGEKITVPAESVDDDTCPCFIFTARDDTLVTVQNILDFEQKLTDFGIMYESHIYAYGGHGFSTCSTSFWDGKVCSRVSRWVKDSIEWLEDIFGKVTPAGMTDPACGVRINGDYEKELSVRCTIAYLEKQGEEVAKILSPILSAVFKVFDPEDKNDEITSLIIKGMQLDSAMRILKMDEAAILKINSELKKFPNIKKQIDNIG